MTTQINSLKEASYPPVRTGSVLCPGWMFGQPSPNRSVTHLDPPFSQEAKPWRPSQIKLLSVHDVLSQWKIRVAVPAESQPRQNRATQPGINSGPNVGGISTELANNKVVFLGVFFVFVLTRIRTLIVTVTLKIAHFWLTVPANRTGSPTGLQQHWRTTTTTTLNKNYNSEQQQRRRHCTTTTTTATLRDRYYIFDVLRAVNREGSHTRAKQNVFLPQVTILIHYSIHIPPMRIEEI